MIDRVGPGMPISVVIPCYNVRSYVGATLDSLIAQTHQEWQALVIDDGSSDGTSEIVGSYGDGRIQLIRQSNLGVSAARNRGIEAATGEAVLFLDADDWLGVDALSRMIASLQASADAVAVYGAFCFMTEDASRMVRRKTGPFVQGDIVERLLVENVFANGGHLLIRRSAVEAAGRFRSDLKFGEDWEYWCRIALCGRVGVVPGEAPLLFVRQRSTGAYLRMATDPGAFLPCTDAIFDNPEVRRHVPAARLVELRSAVDAENNWIIGRESLRHGRRTVGLQWLRRSFGSKPGPKRALLLIVAHLLPIFPARLAGPFRPYGPEGRPPGTLL